MNLNRHSRMIWLKPSELFPAQTREEGVGRNLGTSLACDCPWAPRRPAWQEVFAALCPEGGL
eukprot:3230650-Amphidinium_carterae.1